jgi:hypothetical protein
LPSQRRVDDARLAGDVLEGHGLIAALDEELAPP